MPDDANPERTPVASSAISAREAQRPRRVLVACDAIFKLGIRCCGWNPERDYWHPFGAVTGPAVLVSDWLRKAATGEAIPIDTARAGHLAGRGRPSRAAVAGSAT